MSMLSLPTDETEDALRPDRTVWVAASAGAGKTTILTRRVLSLLLHGTPPGRILCLTFTKAAAAEMQNRINERLGGWAAADDKTLERELRDLLGRAAAAAERRIARGLFAQVLDVPGGMKIQTIHAFCQSLLRRFPVESGLAPHFKVMDDRTAAELMLAARDDLLRHARRDPSGPVGRAWETVTAETNEESFAALMRDLAAKRGRLKRLFENRGLAGAQALLRARLGLAEGETAAGILAAGIADAAFDLAGLRGAAARLAGGSDAEQQRAGVMADYLAAPEQRAVKFDDYCQCFLTKEGTPRARLINKGTAGNTDAPEILQREAERLVKLRERLRAAKLADVGSALLALAGDQLAAYERHKARRAALDYDDLILKTRDLLRGDGDFAAGAAAWVLFKLDGGLDHILVDEAQDTSPEQWEVVSTVAEEFFAGEGARERPRTVFVVGDLKQSIYSFQGADPEAFLRMRGHFQERALRAAAWRETDLLMSYRSTEAVLRTVDAVFATDPARVGVAENGQTIKHNLKRIGQAGLVELWPPVAPRAPEPVAPWASPTETQAGDSPQSRLAAVIAAQIAAWIGREELPSYGRKMRAGDMMVLVRRRTGFVSELVRDLKARGVPVAGVDRMVLTEQLAVMDLVAFGQFLLLPEDDLTLATVLKSPLLGLDEGQLFEIAHGRGRVSLWDALAKRAARDGEAGPFQAAHALLARYLALTDYARPYELYGELLGRDGGRRKILARLGAEAEDAVAEFLNRALGYEREAAPSLQGFLHWFAAGEAEIKRDLEQSVRDEVRIMTVHGAKGLQAPVVILPDTMQIPSKQDALLWTALSGDEDAPGARILPLWPPRTADDEAVAAAERAEAKRRAQEEYRRLLYVALTRAEDRLYVCGWQGKTAPSPDCWYNLVQAGLRSLVEEGAATAAEFDFTALTPDGWSGAGLRLAQDQSRDPDKLKQDAGGAPQALAPLEDWARIPAKPEERPSRPLAPSKPEAGEAEPAMLSPFAAEDQGRFQRGLLIHRLLQSLPDLAPEARADAAARYLARPLWNLPAVQQQAIAAEALRVLEDERFAALFGPGSQAEISITGRVGARAVSGQIDRLVALEDRVLIVDYKSNRPPPTRVEDVPLAYLRQLAAYRALLAQIYVGKRVECALLWTDGPLWMEIPAELLDAQSLPA